MYRKMFSMAEMSSSASTLFSAYASLAATMMLVRSMANEVIPSPIRSYIESAIHYLFTPISNQLTIIVDEQCGLSRNEVYDAAEIYLRKKISPNTERLKVGKVPRRKTLSISMEKGEEITDTFQNFTLNWKFLSIEPTKESYNSEKRFFELCFNKKFKERVLNDYLPFVSSKSREIKELEKVVKLYTRDDIFDDGDEGFGCGGRGWGSINLEHPSTFETLAMDTETKKMIVEDLERFLRRRDFYKKVGKAWKRGYLLYGPPGTGKSSLIAAMANYLKFDIYDLELTSLYSNSDLKRILVSTTNRSIVVIEDIDCSVEMQNRQLGNEASESKLTLSGLLNFIDGLWSSVGDERIIIFTTNHKDRLDPALLRPGRMDVHIHMSYCTIQGFKILARNYLGIDEDHHHELLGDIEGLLQNVQVSPAEVAEELMKSEDADVALDGLVSFLKRKQIEAEDQMESKATEIKKEQTNELEIQEDKRVKADSIFKKTLRKCKPKKGQSWGEKMNKYNVHLYSSNLTLRKCRRKRGNQRRTYPLVDRDSEK